MNFARAMFPNRLLTMGNFEFFTLVKNIAGPCGKKPQSSGDRGGWMQYTVFLVMLAGVGVVGSVLIRNVIRRDRAIAEKMSQDE